jgi:alkylhydroperoxidase/carboxymuconolactone decarboxylase family protein YurZ
MENSNPLLVFAKEAPALAAAFDNVIAALKESNGLDEKTKHLIYISMKAASGDNAAVFFHVPMAKKLGATRNEVRDAVLMTITVCGLQAIARCLPAALDIFDKAI